MADREVEITQPVAINDEFILNFGDKIVVMEKDDEGSTQEDVQVDEDVQRQEESVEERLERLKAESESETEPKDEE